MSRRPPDFAGGDVAAVLLAVLGLVGLATQSYTALLLPVGLVLGVRQVLRHRRETRALFAEQAARRPADWMDRLADRDASP